MSSEAARLAQGTLAATAMLGLSINHSTFVCTRYNEPLMTSVAGNLKVHAFAPEDSSACKYEGRRQPLCSGRHSDRAPLPLMLTGLPGADAQNVLGTVIGALIFPDFRFHPLNVVGLALGMAGAVWYATQAALKVWEHHVAGCMWCVSALSSLLRSAIRRQQRVIFLCMLGATQWVAMSSLSYLTVANCRPRADSCQCCLRNGLRLAGSGPHGRIPAKVLPAAKALMRACRDRLATSGSPAANF